MVIIKHILCKLILTDLFFTIEESLTSDIISWLVVWMEWWEDTGTNKDT